MPVRVIHSDAPFFLFFFALGMRFTGQQEREINFSVMTGGDKKDKKIGLIIVSLSIQTGAVIQCTYLMRAHVDSLMPPSPQGCAMSRVL